MKKIKMTKNNGLEMAAAIAEFRFNKNSNELHFSVVQGSFGPSAAQATKVKDIMKKRGVGKTRFHIYRDGVTVKEV